MITSDRNSRVKPRLNITPEGERTVHAHVFLFQGRAVLSVGEPELDTTRYLSPVAIDYPVGFVAASSLLIYRITQQISSDRLPLRRPDHRNDRFALLSRSNTEKRASIQRAY